MRLAPTLPCPAGVTTQPQSLGLAPGLLCAGVVSEAWFPVPSLPAPCLQGGRSNRMQIMKPESYSCIIPHLCQMHFITVLGGVSKCQAGGSMVHPAGPAIAGVVGEAPCAVCSLPDPLLSQWLTLKAPQESWGRTKAPSWVPKQSGSFPWVMSVSKDQRWDLESWR